MRPVTLYRLSRRSGTDRTGHHRPERLTVHTARGCIGAARKGVDTVHVYETTDRDGNSLHIAHVHQSFSYWNSGAFITEIYVIPTDALTDL
ncbi:MULTISPECIES: hypothetical protein [Streptomyces]|uniref:Uncharacterized protein n=1 Tax=Streptomyces viridochromogenes TaxID=1938 RepID=A0A0L8K2J7_STRVR|nr:MULTISPECIES: hypothetical protein [Streptomyces]KOG20004.1 hypothetical protein ADK34_24170 [Streptomyces viridochromogenes]